MHFCSCICSKDTSLWTGTYQTLHFYYTPHSVLSSRSPFAFSFMLFIPPHSCPWEFSHGIMLLETFPLCIHVTRLAVTGCYCVSLKWCRCYQFHCRLWMLNMWNRRGRWWGWWGWCWGLTASGSWSAHGCELLQLIFFLFLFFFQIIRYGHFYGFLAPFSIVTNGELVDERWRRTMAKWYACKTEPKKWKNMADMK